MFVLGLWVCVLQLSLRKIILKELKRGELHLFLATAIGASSFFSYIIHVTFLHYKRSCRRGTNYKQPVQPTTLDKIPSSVWI